MVGIYSDVFNTIISYAIVLPAEKARYLCCQLLKQIITPDFINIAKSRSKGIIFLLLQSTGRK